MTPYKYRLCKNNKLNNNEDDESLLILENYNILDRDTSDEINYDDDIRPQRGDDMLENKSTKNITNYNSIYSDYNKNITAKYIYRHIFYINLLAIIGLVINIFCYYDIQCIVDNKNNTYIDSNTIIINIYNINIIYYYVNIILMWYVYYISINILTFLFGFCMSIKMILVMYLLKINNIIFMLSLLLRFLQFTILSICIFNDTYIFQLYNKNKTIIYYNNTTTLNIQVPLYLELIILETILYIFIAFMIGIINSKISIVQTVV